MCVYVWVDGRLAVPMVTCERARVTHRQSVAQEEREERRGEERRGEERKCAVLRMSLSLCECACVKVEKKGVPFCLPRRRTNRPFLSSFLVRRTKSKRM